jgi:hypothetical protein
MARNCGECLMTDVEVVPLDASGKCPRCGTDYGPDADPLHNNPTIQAQRQTDRQTAPGGRGRDRVRSTGRRVGPDGSSS